MWSMFKFPGFIWFLPPAKTSSAEPEETPSDSVPPLSESGHPQFTPQSQGPDPETCPQPVPECDTKEHVGR